MKDKIFGYLKNGKNLDQISYLLIELLKEIHNEGNENIGYVCGVISSEGPENIDKNLVRLENYTEQIRKQYDYPIFSQNDIFTPVVYKIIKESGATHDDFEKFYQKVHGSGLITYLFMTPKWELSKGATDEYKTAQRCGIKVVFIEK
ncbi:MAG: hypothetical protein WC069_03140 [Candidatus Shapirobacteria bacterium]